MAELVNYRHCSHVDQDQEGGVDDSTFCDSSGPVGRSQGVLRRRRYDPPAVGASVSPPASVHQDL